MGEKTEKVPIFDRILFIKGAKPITQRFYGVTVDTNLGKIYIHSPKGSIQTIDASKISLKALSEKGNQVTMYVVHPIEDMCLKQGDTIKINVEERGPNKSNMEPLVNKLKIIKAKFKSSVPDDRKKQRDAKALAAARPVIPTVSQSSSRTSCSIIHPKHYARAASSIEVDRGSKSSKMSPQTIRNPMNLMEDFSQPLHPTTPKTPKEPIGENRTRLRDCNGNRSVKKSRFVGLDDVASECENIYDRPAKSLSDKAKAPVVDGQLKQRVSVEYTKRSQDAPDEKPDDIKPNRLWANKKTKLPLEEEKISIERPSNVVTGSKPKDQLEYRRLMNIGNSCYMNSTFQALCSMEGFMLRIRLCYLYLFRMKTTKLDFSYIKMKRPESAAELMKMVCEVLVHLTNKKSETRVKMTKLETIREKFGAINSELGSDKQQDAHEFLTYLLMVFDDFHAAVLKMMTEEKCYKIKKAKRIMYVEEMKELVPTDELVVWTRSRFTCTNCNYKRTQEPTKTLDICVNIRSNQTLQELFNDVFPCTLNSDLKCEKCGERGMKMSQKVVGMPEHLVVNLKRYRVSNGVPKKENDAIVQVQTILYSSEVMKYQEEVKQTNYSEDELDLDDDLEVSTKQDDNQEEAPPPTPPPRSDLMDADVDMKETLPTEDENGNAEEGEEVEQKQKSFQPSKIPNVKKKRPSHVDIFDEDDKLKSAPLPPGMRGGSKDDELEILTEKVYDKYPFSPLIDAEKILEKLQNIEGLEKNGDDIKQHLQRFPVKRIDEFGRHDRPSQSVSVNPDGNCFYRSISWWMTGDEKYHKLFRDANVKLMGENSDLFQSTTHDFNDLIQTAKRENEWSNEVEIMAMCTLFDIDIYTYLCGTWVRYMPRYRKSEDGNSLIEQQREAIYLSNRSNAHFDVVLAVGRCDDPRKNRKRSSPREDDEQGDNDNNDSDDDENSKYGNEGTSGAKRVKYERTCKDSNKNYKESCSTKNEDIVDEIVDWNLAEGSPVYRLVAVVCHIGSSFHSGHYISYTRDSTSGKWLHCSDDVIQEVKLKYVLAKSSETGYVFYYSKIENVKNEIRVAEKMKH